MSIASPPAQFLATTEPIRVEHVLDVAAGPLSTYWAIPSQRIWAAGYGVAAEGGGQVAWTSSDIRPPGPWFGGWGFDRARTWLDFPHERWILPEVLVWRVGDLTFATAFGPADDSALVRRRLADLRPAGSDETTGTVHLQLGGREEYEALVRAALDRIDAGEFRKLVVARQIRLSSSTGFNSALVLRRLETRFPVCRTFLVSGYDGARFVGASPELLCAVAGTRFRTEAVAGTAAPDDGEALLRSSKDRREHQLTVEGILTTLAPFCEHIESAADPSLRRLANVAHLVTPIAATLRNGVDPLEVARTVHPTPAVAGLPRDSALEFLRRHEGFARGWYAGAVGWMGDQGIELGVGLRSALLTGGQATVFGGAGIVAGSRPASEWLETERKVAPIVSILGAGVG